MSVCTLTEETFGVHHFSFDNMDQCIEQVGVSCMIYYLPNWGNDWCVCSPKTLALDRLNIYMNASTQHAGSIYNTPHIKENDT